MSLELKETILELLEILPPSDRDLRTIVICSNPNHYYGSDNSLKPIIENIIKELLAEGIIKAGNYTIRYTANDSNKDRKITVYQLKKYR